MKKSYNDYLKRPIANNKIIAIICFPLFLFSKIIPKSNKIKLFGSMNGFDIVDNSKYLFINEYKKGYYFITKNKDILKAPVFENVYPVYYLSLKGIILQLIASEVYYTHSIFDYFSPIIMGSKIIALWHGVPGKKINTALEEQKKYLRKIPFFIYAYIFPYKYYAYCNEVWCPSENLVPIYNECFKIGKPKIIIHKQPRNIYSKQLQSNNNLIIYAPTYRRNINLYSLMNSLGFFDATTIELLEKHKIQIVIRPHPIDLEILKNTQLPDCYKLDSSADIYSSICSYDLLITDYSSLYFDALELNIKTIFLQNDINDYNTKNGLFDSFKDLIKKESKHNIYEVLNAYYEENWNK